jgi:hypothetical protein
MEQNCDTEDKATTKHGRLVQVNMWVVKLRNVLVGYQRFGRTCCLHLQGEVK